MRLRIVTIYSMNQFSIWFQNQFIEWEKSQGRRQTVTDFTKYLGLKQAVVSNYLNGKRTPTGENVHKIAQILGPAIYKILDAEPPDADFRRLANIWDKIPESDRHQILEQAERYYTDNHQDDEKSTNNTPAGEPSI